MKIEEILRKKGHDVLTITESKSVLAAAEVLVEHNIGGLVVMEGEHATGIVTERDICGSRRGAPVSSTRFKWAR